MIYRRVKSEERILHMKVGYVRVSTEGQNTARQEVLMDELGVEKIFVDKASGKSKDRPALKELMSFVREGDVVITESVSRFARNTRDFLLLFDELMEKKVDFVSKKEQFDTSTPVGKCMITMMAAFAELEREQILQRQREGIEAARLEGRCAGRPRIEIPTDDRFVRLYKEWKDNKITARAFMKEIDVKPNSFYKKIKEYEEEISK